MRLLDSDAWFPASEVRALERELQEIAAAFRELPSERMKIAFQRVAEAHTVAGSRCKCAIERFDDPLSCMTTYEYSAERHRAVRAAASRDRSRVSRIASFQDRRSPQRHLRGRREGPSRFTIASETRTARTCSNACWNFVRWQLSTSGRSYSRSALFPPIPPTLGATASLTLFPPVQGWFAPGTGLTIELVCSGEKRVHNAGSIFFEQEETKETK